MNARQQKVLVRFGQVLTFLDANTSSIPPTSVASQRDALLTATALITGFAQDQVAKGTESVLARTLSSARTALRDTHMRPLARVALRRLIGMNAGDPVVPNAQLIFALPVPRTHPLTLVASATSMLEAARPYAAIFAADGVDLDAVPAAMQAVQDAVKAKYSPARLKKGAAQGIRDQIKAGHGAIARMDEVIRPLLASDSALLTQWESVKRTAGGHNLTTPVPVPGVMIALNRAMSPAAKRLAASPPELELVRTELAPRPLDPVGSVS